VIKAICGTGGEPTFVASVDGIAVYLDNWAIKTLAKGDPGLRQRFVAALRGGVDLLFSTAHAVEIIGPQGASSDAFRSFLNELGPHWFPVELKVFEVVEREARGLELSRCCIDEELLTAYFKSATSEHRPGSGLIIDLSETFFKLGAFIDWLAPQREVFRAKCEEFDRTVKENIGRLRARSKVEPGWLDRVLPQQRFEASRPATFSCASLTREMVLDTGYQIKKGDGIDFCHAVMASAFATFATLDKQWKRRIDNLPKPNRTARTYYEPQLAAMMDDIEAAIVQLKPLRRKR
jgi:hypothetical protein